MKLEVLAVIVNVASAVMVAVVLYLPSSSSSSSWKFHLAMTGNTSSKSILDTDTSREKDGGRTKGPALIFSPCLPPQPVLTDEEQDKDDGGELVGDDTTPLSLSFRSLLLLSNPCSLL
jgi:hypothetical protein